MQSAILAHSEVMDHGNAKLKTILREFVLSVSSFLGGKGLEKLECSKNMKK